MEKLTYEVSLCSVYARLRHMRETEIYNLITFFKLAFEIRADFSFDHSTPQFTRERQGPIQKSINFFNKCLINLQ